MSRILIAGCGYVGMALARKLAGEGHEVWGMRRRRYTPPEGVLPVLADLLQPESLSALPERIDSVVFAASPDRRDEEAYRAVFLDGLGNLTRMLKELGESPRRLVMISSTSVYGQRRGEEVDEESITHPARFNGELLLFGERLALASGIRSTVLRLAGIYGPTRTRLLESVRDGRALIRPGGPHYTNRIHRDDAVGAIAHLLALEDPAPIYVGVDNEPADEGEMYEWLAKEMGVATPPVGEGGAGPKRAGSKRCSNRLLVESGYAFRYPSFREGYGALLADAPPSP